MNEEQQLQQLKEAYLNTPVPPEGPAQMEAAIARAKAEKALLEAKKITPIRKVFAGIAAAAAICVLLPNINQDIAMAMENIPVIGGLVKVVTFNRYTYEDERHQADVSVPRLETDQADSLEGAQQINRSVEAYTDQLIQAFQAEVAANQGGYEGLDISYDVITDSDTWFTLRLVSLETKASGYQQIRYYHIDKTTGQQVILKDLFPQGSDYITPVSASIISQMRQQMAEDESMLYFIDSDMPELDFKQIRADQDFYWNEKGELVIVFDEYEAAPGYMGNPEFVIPHEVRAAVK